MTVEAINLAKKLSTFSEYWSPKRATGVIAKAMGFKAGPSVHGYSGEVQAVAKRSTAIRSARSRACQRS